MYSKYVLGCIGRKKCILNNNYFLKIYLEYIFEGTYWNKYTFFSKLCKLNDWFIITYTRQICNQWTLIISNKLKKIFYITKLEINLKCILKKLYKKIIKIIIILLKLKQN